MKFSNWMRAGAALVACAGAGVAGAIAGSAAAPSTTSRASGNAPAPAASTGRAARARPPHVRRHAVHAEVVVLNRAGTAFITQTLDNGTITSVAGRDVTIAEAIAGVAYKDVTIALPADATIRRNGAAATVDDLKAGDRIHVMQSSDGVAVHAGDASFRPRRGPGHRGPRRP